MFFEHKSGNPKKPCGGLRLVRVVGRTIFPGTLEGRGGQILGWLPITGLIQEIVINAG
jgi:hypothetical protein